MRRRMEWAEEQRLLAEEKARQPVPEIPVELPGVAIDLPCELPSESVEKIEQSEHSVEKVKRIRKPNKVKKVNKKGKK